MISLPLAIRPSTSIATEKRSPVALERLSIELTNQCSKGCWFCYNHSSASGDTFWKAEVLVDFVRDAATHGVRAISFGGGEPLQYPALFEVLTRLKGILFRSITTNGLYLNRHWQQLLDSQPDKVHVSIHFPDKFTEVERVIEQVKQLEQAGIHSGINLLVQQSKLAEVAKTVKLIHQAGITNQRMVYLPMRHQDTPSAKDIAALAGGPFQSMTCLSQCQRSSRFCSINWRGEVAWCSYTQTRKLLKAFTYHELTDTLADLGLEYCGNG